MPSSARWRDGVQASWSVSYVEDVWRHPQRSEEIIAPIGDGASGLCQSRWSRGFMPIHVLRHAFRNAVLALQSVGRGGAWGRGLRPHPSNCKLAKNLFI